MSKDSGKPDKPSASEWSIAWWKQRHDETYFPVMDWHKDWKICPYPPPNVVELLQPRRHQMVLEIGCGYGEWMVPLHKATGCYACGIDIHPILASKAADKFRENDCAGKCEFRLCDGVSIPYPSNWFNSAYSISVFQHMPRATVKSYFAETVRVVGDGGGVLFHFRHDDGKGDYSQDIAVGHDMLGRDFSVGWSEEEIRKAADAVNMDVLSVIADGNHSIFLHGRVNK